MRTLHWNHPGRTERTPHEMRVTQQTLGCKVLLLLEKKGGPLSIEADFPQLTEAGFIVAWNAQDDGCWKEVDDVEDGNTFFAIRYIALAKDAYVVWRTDHRDDVAYDTLTFFRGTFQEMREFYACRVKE